MPTSTWYDLVRSGVKAAVAAAWPEVQPGCFWMDIAAQKRDWTNLLDSGQIPSAPWIVCKFDVQPTDEWGTGALRFLLTVTVWYIAADNAAGAGTPIDIFLLDKLIDLQEAIPTNVPGTILSEFTPNANTDNPIDVSMLDADQRFSAGSLTFQDVVVAI